LGAATLQVHHDATLQKRIADVVHYRKSSEAREGLASPFNFAPFYLEDFLASSPGGVPPRLVYLDTDVILRADVRDLAALDLQDRPAAAVEDCSQHFELYIDFAEIKRLGFDLTPNDVPNGIDPKACVFNRGVFVVDTRRWKQLRITPAIELWMKRYREAEKDIYRFGMSQPPWLLALHGRYTPLSKDWNCRGLSREFMDPDDKKALQEELGQSSKTLKKALKLKSAGEWTRPYVATCTVGAKLLHFNGGLKPWKKDSWKKEQLAPLCALKGKPVPVAGEASSLSKSFERCSDVWSVYFSSEGAKKLNQMQKDMQ